MEDNRPYNFFLSDLFTTLKTYINSSTMPNKIRIRLQQGRKNNTVDAQMESLLSGREAISSKKWLWANSVFADDMHGYLSLHYLPFPFITLFIANLFASSAFFSTFILPLTFTSLYLWLNLSLPPVAPFLTPHSPLLPLVPSQTNGPHYKLTKNSPTAKSIHFFLSVFLSFSLPNAPIFSPFRTSLRREMSNGEKACQLIYQLAARVQLPVLSGLSGWGCGTEGLRSGPWLSVCLSVCHGSCHMAVELGGQAENSEWSVFMGKCRTAPIGHTRGLKSTGKAGGRHCARRIYHKGWGAAEEKSRGLMHE